MSSEKGPGPAAQAPQAAAPPPPPQDPDTEMADSLPPSQPSPSQQQQQQQQNPSAPPAQPALNANPTAGPSSDLPQEAEEDEPPAAPPPVPGPRAARLQALFAAAAKHSLDKISMDNFAACFPTVAARAPGTLEFVQRKMVERLGDLWHKEFETIMANRQVVARLNELEGLIEDAARRKMASPDPTSPPIAPHTLPASTVLQAHLAPHLTAQQSQLSAKLADSQAANARLWEEIQAQRAEMEALLAGVEKALRDVDGANALLGEVADELAAETRGAEADVRAVTAKGGAVGGK